MCMQTVHHAAGGWRPTYHRLAPRVPPPLPPALLLLLMLFLLSLLVVLLLPILSLLLWGQRPSKAQKLMQRSRLKSLRAGDPLGFALCHSR